VIVPAFNAEKTIERTIHSVLSQSYSNIEVVVINDGSSDNTAGCVKSLCEKDLRVHLINQTNQGVSVARNTGIEQSAGEYIVFLDSDDYLENSFVSTLVSLISKSNSDIAFCAYRWVDENDAILKSVIPNIEEGVVRHGESVLISIFDGSMNIWTGSALYRKDFIEQRKDVLVFLGASKYVS